MSTVLKFVITVTKKSFVGPPRESKFPGEGATLVAAEKDAMHFITVHNTSPYTKNDRYTIISKQFFDKDGNELHKKEENAAA